MTCNILIWKGRYFKNTLHETVVMFQFDGENGDRFKRACATFCGNQSHALEVLRSKQKKEPKFATFLQVGDEMIVLVVLGV